MVGRKIPLTGVQESVSEAAEIFGCEGEQMIEELLPLLLRPQEGVPLVALAGELLLR